MTLKTADLPIQQLIESEKKRQQKTINLIASENYVSEAVLEALGSVLTNKYSEGYPGKRYYAGQKNIDKIEQLAQQRALKVFNISERDYHVNVQPYSGSPANIAVYTAIANHGDTLMGMGLNHGGHLTHGHHVNFSGKWFQAVHYGLAEGNEHLDFNQIREIAKAKKPKILISGATAYPRIIDFQQFQSIAEGVGAIHVADISHIVGLIIAGVHPSPFPFTDIVTTTTHKTLRGPRGAIILCKKKFADVIDRAIFPGSQGGPHENTIAAIAVCLQEASTTKFKHYGKQIITNAETLANELKKGGYRLVSQGTDNHLMLVDLTSKHITGKQAQENLERVGITVNKNTIPFETRSPFDPSGIRIGTPAVTTRGMKEKEMTSIARLIDESLLNYSSAHLKNISQEVRSLAGHFPLPYR